MHIDSPDPTITSFTRPTSYLNTLISNTPVPHSLFQLYYPTTHLDLTDESNAPNDPTNFIPLSPEEKNRLYAPWKHSVIVKVFGRRIGHQLLRQKIYAQWKPTENLPLIDLGSDFFLIKF